MGWSCRTDAMDTLKEIEKFFQARCIDERGASNQIICLSHARDHKDWTGFYELSRREHADGAITGTCWKTVSAEGHVRKVGSFRIEGHGGITRFPGLSLQEQAHIHAKCPWFVGDYSNPRN